MDVESYAPGAPCWLDLTCPDPATVHAFYRDLFGWTHRADAEDGEGFGTFSLAGREIAGIGPCPPERGASWNVYLNTPDLDACLADVEKFGGRVLVGPVELEGRGRGGACVDPTGGVFSVWEAGGHIGSGLTGVPGTWCWTELLTADVEMAAQFYANVFDWVIDVENVDGVDLGVAAIDGEAVAGLVTPPAQANIGTVWTVSFAVGDADSIARIAPALGGQVAVPPTDIPGMGRYALIGGPGGEAFSVVARDDSVR
ncbi:MAG: VOC family protein [Sporichthyaceae bacterium]